MKRLLAFLLLWPLFAFGQTPPPLLGSGLVVKGQVGAFGALRGDSIMELQNQTFGQKALLSIYNVDPHMESAITYGTMFDDGHNYSIASNFAMTVNGGNGWGWRGSYGIHVTGHLRDSQVFTGWSNNSVRLGAGTVNLPTWSDPAEDDTVELGYGGVQKAGMGLVLFDLPAPPASNPKGGTIIYRYNGTLWIKPPGGGAPKQLAP